MSKTLLTIGTNAPLGVATAIRFAQAGYRIVLVSGSPRAGERGVAQITRAVPGAEVLMTTVDLADPVLAAVHVVLPVTRMRGSGSILLTTSALATEPDATRLTLSIGSAAVRTLVAALFEPLRQKGVYIAAVSLPLEQGNDACEVHEITEQFWQLHGEPLAIRD